MTQRRIHATLPALFALPLLAATGCSEDDGTGTDANTPRVTYYEDVLPVFAANCNSCHVEGAVAPFALDSYEAAKEWASAIAVSVEHRTMPPFPANNDGECGGYKDAQWLSAEEIQMVVDWADQGAPEGDPETPRPPNRVPTVLSAGETLELSIPEGYVPVPETNPGGEFEDYQCFMALEAVDRDRYITGFDVLPGNAKTVHHVLAMEVDLDFLQNRAIIEELDAASPDQQGWTCFGAAGDGVIPEGVPVAWAPGTGAVNFPEGTGILLEEGHSLVIQMHYNLVNDGGPDTTKVKLAVADSVERVAKNTLWDPFLFSSVIGMPDSIPPGLENAEYQWESLMSEATFDEGEDRDIEVLGILPHMHGRGRTLSLEFGNPDAQMACGANVDRWDFNWQRMYFFEEPRRMRMSDTIRVVCGYDTTADTEPVLPGFGTSDEMCLVGLYVVDAR